MKKQIFRSLALIAALGVAAALLLALGLVYAFPGFPLLPWACAGAGAALLALLLVLGSALSSRVVRRAVRPLEEMAERPDLGGPISQSGGEYPEMAPLLEKLRERQRGLRRQVEELTEERDALRVITGNMQKELERQRQEFTSNIAQLRPHLAALSGLGEGISNAAPGEEAPKLGEGVIREASRMTALLDDMLRFSRLGEAAPTPMTRVSLTAVCRETLTSLSLMAHQRGVGLKLTGPEVWAKGDAGMLGELMTSLCENAIQYNRQDGSVLVETGSGPDAGTVWVAVRDTGIGIPEGSFQRIFDRFYRLEEGRAQQALGTGLGLSIAKRLADFHQGSITLESTPGEGSVFTVTLPAWREGAAPREASPAAAAEPVAAG